MTAYFSLWHYIPLYYCNIVKTATVKVVFIPKNEFPESVKGLFSFYFILLRFFSKKILVPQIPRSADLQSCDARLHSVEPKGHGCACIRHHQAKLIRENQKKNQSEKEREVEALDILEGYIFHICANPTCCLSLTLISKIYHFVISIKR